MQKFAHVKCHKFPGIKDKIKTNELGFKKISEHTFTSQDFPWYLFFLPSMQPHILGVKGWRRSGE